MYPFLLSGVAVPLPINGTFTTGQVVTIATFIKEVFPLVDFLFSFYLLSASFVGNFIGRLVINIIVTTTASK
jgi:hypothetical protein